MERLSVQGLVSVPGMVWCTRPRPGMNWRIGWWRCLIAARWPECLKNLTDFVDKVCTPRTHSRTRSAECEVAALFRGGLCSRAGRARLYPSRELHVLAAWQTMKICCIQ